MKHLWLGLFVMSCACQQTSTSTPARTAPAAALDEFTSEDRVCRQASDCRAITSMYVNDDGACCRSCSYEVLSKHAADRADTSCASLGSQGCPMKKCVAPPKIDCVDGLCMARTP